MKLVTRCKSCKNEIGFTSFVQDRVILEMEKGKEFPLTCNVCHKKSKYHVNEFKAQKSFAQKIVLVAIPASFIIFLVTMEFYVFTLGVFFYGGIFLAPSIAYGIINRQQQIHLNSFNRYKVKE